MIESFNPDKKTTFRVGKDKVKFIEEKLPSIVDGQVLGDKYFVWVGFEDGSGVKYFHPYKIHYGVNKPKEIRKPTREELHEEIVEQQQEEFTKKKMLKTIPEATDANRALDQLRKLIDERDD